MFPEPFLVILVCSVHLPQAPAACGVEGVSQAGPRTSLWGGGYSGSRKDYFPRLLIIGVTPHQSPCWWCWRDPMLSGELLFDWGRKEPSRLLSLAGWSVGAGGSGRLLLLDGDIRCPAACSSGSRPQTSLPSWLISVFLWLHLALFPEFIVAFSGGGTEEGVYTILSRLESYILFKCISYRKYITAFCSLRTFTAYMIPYLCYDFYLLILISFLLFYVMSL